MQGHDRAQQALALILWGGMPGHPCGSRVLAGPVGVVPDRPGAGWHPTAGHGRHGWRAAGAAAVGPGQPAAATAARVDGRLVCGCGGLKHEAKNPGCWRVLSAHAHFPTSRISKASGQHSRVCLIPLAPPPPPSLQPAASHAQLATAPPAALADVMWALGRLQQPLPDSWWEAAQAAIHGQLQQLDTQVRCGTAAHAVTAPCSTLPARLPQCLDQSRSQLIVQAAMPSCTLPPLRAPLPFPSTTTLQQL